MHSTLPLMVVLGLAGQAEELPPFVKEYVKTATYYYTAPDPSLGPKMLKALLEKENLEHAWFKKHDQVLVLIGAQLGDIAAGHPKIIREYEAAFADAPTLGRRVIVRALMNCGDGDSLKKVDAWIDDKDNAQLRPSLEALKNHLENPKRQHVRDRPAKEPKDIDLLWANYFVTGEYAPVSRILDVLDLPDAKENAVLKRVARFSLGSNLQQHPKLVELVQKHAKDRPEGSRKAIEGLILKFPPGEKK